MIDQYTIWTPEWSHMSGGIRALHQLKKELIKRGMKAEFYNESRHKNELFIYPEIIRDNPCEAKRWIKWLLNTADFPYEECWAWEKGMGNFPLLTVNIIEMDLWTPSDKERNGTAYWIGKGRADKDLIPENSIEITRYNFLDRKELAEFISGLDYLISFDPFSAINLEATLVNTPVLIHENGKWTRQQIEQQGWLNNGVAWSLEELDSARESVYYARSNYEKLILEFDKRIDNFVEVTQRAVVA